MLANIKSEDILYIDIETVPQFPNFEEVPDNIKKFWLKKAKQIGENKSEVTENLYERAGIYAEFGKIVCISVGMIRKNEKTKTLRIKSFADYDEFPLLSEFSAMISKMCEKKPVIFCAHNGKEFDYPYISRRLLINGLTIPPTLDTAGKKPWEIPHLDTMELWKFGDYKSYTSLDLLAAIFGIESPKNEMDGSMVATTFWDENDLEKIVEYCQKDVVTVARLLLHFKNEAQFTEIEIVNQ